MDDKKLLNGKFISNTIHALLQEMERERPAQPDNQVTPEPPTKKPTLMLAHESSSDEEGGQY